MYIDYKLKGKYVTLRSVEESDAEFILSVRNNPRISKYLPPLNITIEQQQKWISKQRADNDSYYFLLETPIGEPIGTLSIYDIVDNHGEGGRSCCIGEPFASIEASVLLNDFIFNTLKLSYTIIWVYEGNKAVLSLNKSFGYEWQECRTDEKGEPFRVGKLTKDNYLNNRNSILKKLRLT